MASHHYTNLLALLATAMLLQVAVAGGARQLRRWTAPITTVSMTNALEGQESLEVHCNDVGRRFDVQRVPYGKTYNYMISFYAIGHASGFNCEFAFNGAVHTFDIYLEGRDGYACGEKGVCEWNINELGPCSVDHKCYLWS